MCADCCGSVSRGESASTVQVLITSCDCMLGVVFPSQKGRRLGWLRELSRSRACFLCEQGAQMPNLIYLVYGGPKLTDLV